MSCPAPLLVPGDPTNKIVQNPEVQNMSCPAPSIVPGDPTNKTVRNPDVQKMSCPAPSLVPGDPTNKTVQNPEVQKMRCPGPSLVPGDPTNKIVQNPEAQKFGCPAPLLVPGYPINKIVWDPEPWGISLSLKDSNQAPTKSRIPGLTAFGHTSFSSSGCNLKAIMQFNQGSDALENTQLSLAAKAPDHIRPPGSDPQCLRG